MKVIDLEEAKANLEQFAQECQSSPIIVTLKGKPSFEMVPVRSDDQGFIDRLLEENEDFRKLMEDRHDESRSGKVSPLETVRDRLKEKSD